jgi:flavin-dependent dehydrogenase
MIAAYCILFLIIGFFAGIVTANKSVEIAQRILTDAENRLSRAKYAWERSQELEKNIKIENERMVKRIQEFYNKLGDSIVGSKDA